MLILFLDAAGDGQEALRKEISTPDRCRSVGRGEPGNRCLGTHLGRGAKDKAFH